MSNETVLHAYKDVLIYYIYNMKKIITNTITLIYII
jgi:hypothetical protein